MAADKAESSGVCCGLLRRKAKPFSQAIVVLRHSERLDQMDATYKETEEGKAWPFDTPITEKGFELARGVAAELADLHKEVTFGAVVSSPYRRCMETASEVAKKLGIPIIVDQEIGEVWDSSMPKDTLPHRSAKELRKMADDLKVQVKNPIMSDGGIKVFGKQPVSWPETMEAAHKRYLVRIETYIRQSAATRQNFIIVSHAPSIVAALDILERGNADIAGVSYCALVVAKRQVTQAQIDQEAIGEHGVFADRWQVNWKNLNAEVMEPEAGVAKLYEKEHLDHCDEEQAAMVQRNKRRTKTDALLENTLQNLKDLPDDEDDAQNATAGNSVAAKSNS